jgi:hypothetical protein
MRKSFDDFQRFNAKHKPQKDIHKNNIGSISSIAKPINKLLTVAKNPEVATGTYVLDYKLKKIYIITVIISKEDVKKGGFHKLHLLTHKKLVSIRIALPELN